MIKIFIQYVSEFTNPSTKGYAYVNAVSQIEVQREVLDSEQIKDLLDEITSFAQCYSRSWPWEKGRVVASRILNFTKKVNL